MVAGYDDALLRNLRLMGSDVPIGNTTFSPGIGLNAPTMFSQILQGVTGTFGEEVGGTAQLAAGLMQNPAIRQFMQNIPGLRAIPGYISTLQNLPQVGGAVDPIGFALSKAYSRAASGVEVPQIAPPANFANRQALDAFNEQLKNLDYYMRRQSRPEQQLLVPSMGASEEMELATAFENISRMQQQDRSFRNMFSLFNEVIPGSRASAIAPDIQDQIRQAAINKDEEAISKLLADRDVMNIVKRQASMAKQSSAIMGVSSMLSNFIGSTGMETSQVQGIGDVLRQILQIDQPGVMTSMVTQSLAKMGTLGTATTTSINEKGQEERRTVIGQVAAALQEQIRKSGSNADTRGQGTGMFSMQAQGFERTGQLLQELQASGMLTTGGVDIFGVVKPEDVKKMEQAMTTQLEGFSELARVGRRMGMQISEVTRNLQSIYGGRLPQALREQAMSEMQGVMMDEPNLVDRARKRGVSEEVLGAAGSEQRQQFLELEAQRRAGTTMMQQLEKAVELGRFAGIDSRGVMAVASTVTQMTSDMGLGGDSSMVITQDALSRVALSRQLGEPMTVAQSLAISTGITERGMKETSVRAFAALKKAMNDGLPMPKGEVDLLVSKFKNNEFLDPAVVSNLIRSAGGIPSQYSSDKAIAASLSDRETLESVHQRYTTDQKLSISGALQRTFESGGASTQSMVSAVQGNTQLLNMLGLDPGNVNFTSIAAAYNRIGSDMEANRFLEALGAVLPPEQARLVTGALRSTLRENTSMLSAVGDKPGQSGVNMQLQEEAQRLMYGGKTSPQITAEATSLIRDRFEKAMDGQDRNAIADTLKTMMDRSVRDAEKTIKEGGVAGLTAEELTDIARSRATQAVAQDVQTGSMQLTTGQRERLARLRNVKPEELNAALAANPIQAQEVRALIASGDIDVEGRSAVEKAQLAKGAKPLTDAETRIAAERRAASSNFSAADILQALSGTDMVKFRDTMDTMIETLKKELSALRSDNTPESRRKLEGELERLKNEGQVIIDALKQAAESEGIDHQTASAAADGEYTLKRDLTIVPDSRYEMSPEKAAAKAEEQGVDLNELKIGMSGARERRALRPVEKELREMAYSKAIEAGATKQDAEFAAVSSPFTYDDVYAAIERSSLPDEEKASLKSDIKQYKATRESDLQIGERVVDKNTNQEAERPKALDLDKVTLEDIKEATKWTVKDLKTASAGRMLRTSKDPSRSMNPEQARLKAEAQGVDMNALATVYADDDELSVEFDSIEDSLRTKAKEKFQQVGADEDKAEIAASTVSFSYEDVEQEIAASSLPDSTKARLKQRLDDFRRRREQAIAAGERVEDVLAKKETEYDNAIKLSEITLKDLEEIDKRTSDVSAGGAARTPTIDPAKAAALKTQLAEIESKRSALQEELRALPDVPDAEKKAEIEIRERAIQQLDAAKATPNAIIPALDPAKDPTTLTQEGQNPKASVVQSMDGTPVDTTTTTVEPPAESKPAAAVEGAKLNPEQAKVDPKAPQPQPTPTLAASTSQVPVANLEQVASITSYLRNEMDKKLLGIQQEVSSMNTYIRSRGV